MAAPTSGPCATWITDIPSSYCTDATKRAQAISLATAILYRFSGHQFPGICERTIRPCSADGCGSNRGQFPASWDYAIWDSTIGLWAYGQAVQPYLVAGQWYNLPACGGRCHLPSVRLPGPIVSVSEVIVDGAVLSPSAYRVAAHHELVRIDGNGWPCSNNYALESGLGGGTGTWQITYQFGRGPGADGAVACQMFAQEIARLLCGGPCNLPARIKEISREGVQVVLDPLTYIGKQQTGLPLVDSWLESVNPGKLTRRSAIRRLDKPPTIGRLQ